MPFAREPLSTHTPGPWVRRDTPDYAEIIGPDGGQPVALVGREDDANLIAALPDLLEAIRLALADAGYHLQMYRPHVLDALRDAFAKATRQNHGDVS